jgi:hypothetical protein
LANPNGDILETEKIVGSGARGATVFARTQKEIEGQDQTITRGEQARQDLEAGFGEGMCLVENKHR